MLSNFLIVSYNLYEKKCVAFCVFYMTFYNLHRNSVKLRPKCRKWHFRAYRTQKFPRRHVRTRLDVFRAFVPGAAIDYYFGISLS